MSQFSRAINITCNDLGGRSEPTFFLTFDKQSMKGIYKDYFPVVWKICTFPTEGSFAMQVTYKSQLMYINPRVENDKVVDTATCVKINPGQQTDLIEQPDSTGNSFTPPTSGKRHNFIKATNKTQILQTIGVGFDDGNTSPPTMLVFEDVGSTYNVIAQFLPILNIYISSEYEENSVLRDETDAPLICSMDLAVLDENAAFNLQRDPVSGEYSIIPST